MNFKPKTKHYRKKVEDSFKQQKFMEFIDAKLNALEPGFCEIEVPYNESLTQQNGYFHAGIVATIADNSSGYAAFSLMAENTSVLTVEFKLNLLRPAVGEVLIGRGQVLKEGRTLTVCRSNVYVKKGEKEILCAASQSTLIELKEK